jgi:glycerate kinase
VGVPVVALAGRVDLNQRDLTEAAFDAAHALLDLEPDPVRCVTQAGPLLQDLTRRISSA